MWCAHLLLPKWQRLYCFGYSSRRPCVCVELNPTYESPEAGTSANFDVKFFGTLTSFVSCSITRSKRWIKINQGGYVKQMLKYHGMETANAVKSPLPKTANLLPAQENVEILDHYGHKEYRSMIERLLYLAICTRPKISFSVTVLARLAHAPTSRHLALVKRSALCRRDGTCWSFLPSFLSSFNPVSSPFCWCRLERVSRD